MGDVESGTPWEVKKAGDLRRWGSLGCKILWGSLNLSRLSPHPREEPSEMEPRRPALAFAPGCTALKPQFTSANSALRGQLWGAVLLLHACLQIPSRVELHLSSQDHTSFTPFADSPPCSPPGSWGHLQIHRGSSPCPRVCFWDDPRHEATPTFPALVLHSLRVPRKARILPEFQELLGLPKGETLTGSVPTAPSTARPWSYEANRSFTEPGSWLCYSACVGSSLSGVF